MKALVAMEIDPNETFHQLQTAIEVLELRCNWDDPEEHDSILHLHELLRAIPHNPAECCGHGTGDRNVI